ncbi:Luciferase-like monooxygenase [Pseudonocardia sp. Ae406_Ps2]|uniref:MsnO8 family LLM class oxidoreductase n=1 Tax=unclassified Pseudonocardia TaxID=2619320 RepID=UPI00094AC191|nr:MULTISPECIES: MsnO8 family LLM class oxidoreductase [unclassified Pseudonocardia]OLM00570.1 Luciferase-like monooxygenase [Pseudonocardia sp. Ae406_Ps2]OLM07639.1 Luciferase-like monooxygenase [Pseudonocardia sp. Ae331_Ps2]OLM22143.1 Luciferase-like monooxygenase [Pseudonocardia sp. Ae706_Ps2]OLM31213.1 Luciferase-like monooxygenase [Pseudonocardia sp. Ae717_Ps2]
MIPLSLLDLAPVGEGQSPERALATTVDLARRADRLGFTRFWVAEHHGMPGIASSTPEVLIAAIAARTRTLRIGSGAVLLSGRQPRAVAEAFGVLAALYPDRIDLGVGRGGGTTVSLDAQLDQLGGHLTDPLGSALPHASAPAEVWLVGSSVASALVAAERGLPYAFAHHFFGPTDAVRALETYRSNFRPGPTRSVPHAMLTVHTVCGEDDAHARWLVAPALAPALGVAGLGPRSPFPAPDVAAALPWTTDQLDDAARLLDEQAVGSPATVRRRLHALAETTGADELMLTSNLTDGEDKLGSLGRIVAALGEGDRIRSAVAGPSR